VGTVVVRLRQIIAASKTNIDLGNWRSGKVPRADFPMAKAAYGLGNSYQWCVIKFEALGAKCRVLVVLNPQKQKYEAVLGIEGANGLKILCTYEHHPSEPGWHCHATHDDSDTLNFGCMRGPWIKRVPSARQPHRANKHPKFVIGEQTVAVRFAVDRYKIRTKGPLI
jgi:hypothetical protein